MPDHLHVTWQLLHRRTLAILDSVTAKQTPGEKAILPTEPYKAKLINSW